MTSHSLGGATMLPGPDVFCQLSDEDVNPLFGIEVNALSVDALFDLYERTRFLYPAKREKLAPVWTVVKGNWERLRKAGELLLSSMSVTDHSTGALSSITKWRSSRYGWLIQHLVSDGNPLGTRAVMNGAIAAAYVAGRDRGYQNWFRPDNRFPARVFGTLPSATAPQLAAVHPLRLWNLGRHIAQPACPGGEIHRVRPADDLGNVMELMSLSRGPLWPVIEEMQTDLELNSVNLLYHLVGLSRYRRVWVAVPRGSSRPVMAAAAYRGPLGMNFSFLENRCELIVAPDADPRQVEALAPALLGAVAGAYRDFELSYIPVVSCDTGSEVLTQAGAHWMRNYSQSVWTHEACPDFYRHINNIYERLVRRLNEKEKDDPPAHARHN
jgi:hypothetical protein